MHIKTHTCANAPICKYSMHTYRYICIYVPVHPSAKTNTLSLPLQAKQATRDIDLTGTDFSSMMLIERRIRAMQPW